MSGSSVERWLETFMCKQYADLFERYGFKTLDSVCQLQPSALHSMGIPLDHCDKILENVSVLRQSWKPQSLSVAVGSNYDHGYDHQIVGHRPPSNSYPYPHASPGYTHQQYHANNNGQMNHSMNYPPSNDGYPGGGQAHYGPPAHPRPPPQEVYGQPMYNNHLHPSAAGGTGSGSGGVAAGGAWELYNHSSPRHVMGSSPPPPPSPMMRSPPPVSHYSRHVATNAMEQHPSPNSHHHSAANVWAAQGQGPSPVMVNSPRATPSPSIVHQAGIASPALSNCSPAHVKPFSPPPYSPHPPPAHQQSIGYDYPPPAGGPAHQSPAANVHQQHPPPPPRPPPLPVCHPSDPLQSLQKMVMLDPQQQQQLLRGPGGATPAHKFSCVEQLAGQGEAGTPSPCPSSSSQKSPSSAGKSSINCPEEEAEDDEESLSSNNDEWMSSDGSASAKTLSYNKDQKRTKKRTPQENGLHDNVSDDGRVSQQQHVNDRLGASAEMEESAGIKRPRNLKGKVGDDSGDHLVDPEMGRKRKKRRKMEIGSPVQQNCYQGLSNPENGSESKVAELPMSKCPLKISVTKGTDVINGGGGDRDVYRCDKPVSDNSTDTAIPRTSCDETSGGGDGILVSGNQSSPGGPNERPTSKIEVVSPPKTLILKPLTFVNGEVCGEIITKTVGTAAGCSPATVSLLKPVPSGATPRKRGRPPGSKNKPRPPGYEPVKRSASGNGNSAKTKKPSEVASSTPLSSEQIQQPAGPITPSPISSTKKLGGSGVLKGPYLRIEGSSATEVLINDASKDDLGEGGDARGGGGASGVRNKSWGGHSEVDKEIKKMMLSVGFSSTLSANYDVFTRDKSWVCAFCLKGSHYKGLGDLFGPYFDDSDVGSEKGEKDNGSVKTEAVSSEVDLTEHPAETEETGSNSRKIRAKRKRSELVEEFFKSTLAKKGKRSRGEIVAAVSEVSQTKNPHAKCSSEDDNASQFSQNRANSDVRAETAGISSRELWAHEDCIVWCHGVYLIGPKVIGLKDAVKASYIQKCSKCHETGATVGCRLKGCSEQFHYICAIEKGCEMDDNNFTIYCPRHKPKANTPST